MEKNIIEPKTLPGFMELLPKEQILFNEIQEKIKQTYESFGFLPIDTPIIESAEVLLAKAGGETEKQIYRFNKGDGDLTLRFDLTVPLAKYVALNYNELAFPFRRYQIGKVYRGEKPQKGRFREFYQCDIDIIGDEEISLLNDAEMPSVIYNTFKNIGFDKFTIYINNRKILNGMLESLELSKQSIDIVRIIDKFDKIGKDGVIKELQNLEITDEQINQIIYFVLIDGSNSEKIEKLFSMNIDNELFKIGINELKEVYEKIKLFKVPEEYININLKIARGLDYYTGTVYETLLTDYEYLGSVCSGGRYDNLAEYYTKKKLPGVGISIGLTRLFYQLNENKIIEPKQQSISDVLIVSMDNEIEVCLEIADKLRKNKIKTEVYLEDKKIKNKFKYADKLMIKYVIVIGEDEKNSNILTVKNMQTGEQFRMNINEAIEEIKK